MRRSPLPFAVLIFSAVLAAAAFFLLAIRWGGLSRRLAPSTPAADAPAVAQAEPAAIPEMQPRGIPESPLRDSGLAETQPEALVTRIAKGIGDGDFDGVARLVGESACDGQSLAQLKALATTPALPIRQAGGIREIGELELNARTRWALTLDGAQPGHDTIYLDLLRTGGKWSVEKLTPPPVPGAVSPREVFTDPLAAADGFLQAVIKQDFALACGWVDPQVVSAAKVAALCLLFEEGRYELRRAKPLRAMFRRADTAAYLANVQTADGGKSGQFTLTLRQSPAPPRWVIAEINLDQLLSDTARQVAGGDSFYSPLVKNPQGGDTLVLYFEFGEERMNPRTLRQLEMVSQILRADPRKKVTLSGFTDALGTVESNHQLSLRHAATVREFLTNSGVAAGQIVTHAKGASQPRRPPATDSGQDDPKNRLANRRSEIYLDF